MNWVRISDRLPDEGVLVDLWDGEERHTDYKLVLNCDGKRGNNFFEAAKSGLTIIRYEDLPHRTVATHWCAVHVPGKKQ